MKGRHWTVVWLAVFLAVAALVVARQRAAFQVATRLRALRETHAALAARKAELERAIQARSTAAALLTRLRPLGFDHPADTATTFITVGPAGERGR